MKLTKNHVGLSICDCKLRWGGKEGSALVNRTDEETIEGEREREKRFGLCSQNLWIRDGMKGKQERSGNSSEPRKREAETEWRNRAEET